MSIVAAHPADQENLRRGRIAGFLARNLGILIAAVPAIIIVGLLLGVVWLSFRSETARQLASGPFTLEHYTSLYGHPSVTSAFANTFNFSIQSLIWALIFGVPSAWLVSRTDVGGRTVVYAIATIGVLTPNFFHAMAWVYLLHPRIGTINYWIKEITGIPAAINLLSIPGMAWVQGLSMASLVFVLMAPTLSNMDASLEEASLVHGANFRKTLRRITIPIAGAALLATCLYVLAMTMSTLDIPLVIGVAGNIFVFSSFLFIQTSSPDDARAAYGLSAAFAVLMIILAIILSWAYGRVLAKARNYEVITGKAFKPRIVELGRWKPVARVWLLGTMGMANLLPLAVLVWASFLPYIQPINARAFAALSLANYQNLPLDLIWRGIKNTGLLALLVPTLAVALSLLFSWIVLRSRYRFRRAFDYVAFLPHAVPTVVFAFAAWLLILNYRVGWLDLHGSIWLIVILYILTSLSFATRITNGALIQVHTELEESARLSGADTLTMTKRILVPLLRPALVLAWIWLCMGVFRELTIAVMLLHRNNITLPVVIWQSWARGDQPLAAAITVLMMGIMLPLVLLYYRKYGTSLWDTGGQTVRPGSKEEPEPVGSNSAGVAKA